MVRVLLSPVIKVINHMNQVPMCVLLKQAVGWWFVQTSFRFLKSFRSDHWSTIRGRWVPRSDMMTGWPWLKWNTLTRFGHRCTSSSKFQPEILGRPGVSSALQVHENTTKYLGDPTTHTWNKFCDDNSWLKCIHSFSNKLDQEFFMFFIMRNDKCSYVTKSPKHLQVLLAPKVCFDYLRPLTTIHPTQSHPIPSTYSCEDDISIEDPI